LGIAPSLSHHFDTYLYFSLLSALLMISQIAHAFFHVLMVMEKPKRIDHLISQVKGCSILGTFIQS